MPRKPKAVEAALAPEATPEMPSVDPMFAEFQKQEAGAVKAEKDPDWAPEPKPEKEEKPSIATKQGHPRRRAKAAEERRAEKEVVEEVEAQEEAPVEEEVEEVEEPETTVSAEEDDDYEIARAQLIVSKVKPAFLKGLDRTAIIGLAEAVAARQAPVDNSEPSAPARVAPPEEGRSAEPIVPKGVAAPLAKHFDGDVASALEGVLGTVLNPLAERLASLESGFGQAIRLGKQQYQEAARQSLVERFPGLKDQTIYSSVLPDVQALEASPRFAKRPRDLKFYADILEAGARANRLTEVSAGEKARQVQVRREKQAGQPHATGALADGRQRAGTSEKNSLMFRAYELTRQGKHDEAAAILEGIR